MPVLAKTEPVLDWCHADFQPTGFARSLRSRLGHLLRHRGDVGGVARKMLEDGDLDACHVLYDAMLEAGFPQDRCDKLTLDCQIVANWQRSVGESVLPVTWALTIRSYSRYWVLLRVVAGFHRSQEGMKVLHPQVPAVDYDPLSQRVVRWPTRDDAAAYAADPVAVSYFYRDAILHPTPVRGHVSVPDFLAR